MVIKPNAAVKWFWVVMTLLSPWAHAANFPSSPDIERAYQRFLPYHTQITQRLRQYSPFLTRVSHQLKAQSLPQELLLLPMLESSLNRNAVSHAQAAGLWQLMPATAKRFGLKVTPTHDQRLDPELSTKAALSYLRFLYRKFDQDLSLTLAAYNAGEGRVMRAIGQSNTRQFARLPLPLESQQYVSRFYALTRLIDIHTLITQSEFNLRLFGNKKSDDTPTFD
ncbi:lytic transglycosylase domain-containing protein [Vibrio olivae]